jgi:hypothetical protein
MKKNESLLDLATSETKFLLDVVAMTDRNDHNGALLLIANYTGYKASAKIIQAICQIHEVEQHMPSALNDYRREVSTRLLSDIKRNNPELFTKIQKAL